MAQKRLKYADLAQATSTDQLNSFIARNLGTVCQNRTASCSCCPSSPSLCSGPPGKKTKNPRRRINAKPLLRFVGLSHPTPTNPPCSYSQTPFSSCTTSAASAAARPSSPSPARSWPGRLWPSAPATVSTASRSTWPSATDQRHLQDPPGPLYTDLPPLSSALTAGPSAPPQRQSRHPFRKKKKNATKKLHWS